MRVFRYLVALLALLAAPAAFAQTAQPVTPGYLSTTGCPSVALTPCFIPYGPSGGLAPSSSTLVDRSGTITLGGTAQTLAVANTSRRGYYIQNNTTGDCWWSTLATAVQSQPSTRLPATTLYETPSTMYAPGALSIICAVTGGISAREW